MRVKMRFLTCWLHISLISPHSSEFFDRTARLRIARSRKGMGKSALLSKPAFDLERDLERPLIVRVTGANLIGIAKPDKQARSIL